MIQPTIRNYLTIDVEDYFQVAAFDDFIRSESWDAMESRVERNSAVILDILGKYGVQATFFVVGWIAERYPSIVREIVKRGHELGCHSYMHKKIYDMTQAEFQEDTRRAKNILEDITGHAVFGYRAPSYSITKKSLWALDILDELGFRYDSSIFPIYHDNYGIPDAPRFEYKLPNHNLIEYPISTSLFMGRKIPVAGGGYFRLFPYWFTRSALNKINQQEKKPFVFYIHPWEIDAQQPRMNQAKALSRFRHYNNLHKTSKRFETLLTDFSFGPIGKSNFAGIGR